MTAVDVNRKYELLVEEIGYFLYSYSYEFEAFLDLDTWDVVPCAITPGERPEFYPEEGHRVIKIEQLPSRDGYKIMVDFLDKVEDEKMREQIFAALSRTHPFRRFKQIVLSSPYRSQWYDHYNAAIAKSAREWLDENKVTVEAGELISPNSYEFHFTDYFEDDLLDMELFEDN